MVRMPTSAGSDDKHDRSYIDNGNENDDNDSDNNG